MSNTAAAQRTWLVSGRVQGVGFRYATSKRIEALDLRGEAVNLPDGRVQVRAQGNVAALEKLERWLWKGPIAARVNNVESSDCAPRSEQSP